MVHHPAHLLMGYITHLNIIRDFSTTIRIYVPYIGSNMRNKTISLCEKSHKIASEMTNFSGWLRNKLLEYDPEHQMHQEKIHKKHAWECIRCNKILWEKEKWAQNTCRHCKKLMIYMGHLDRRLY